jgi:hypothetical protein
MKIAVYGVNAEIIALTRAHYLTPIGVDRLVETLTPFFRRATWRRNLERCWPDDRCRRAAGDRDSNRTQEGDKNLWSFWVSGDPQITLFTNSEISAEELRRMDWANAIGGSNSWRYH